MVVTPAKAGAQNPLRHSVLLVRYSFPPIVIPAKAGIYNFYSPPTTSASTNASRYTLIFPALFFRDLRVLRGKFSIILTNNLGALCG
jgi:hypothetical protein